MTSWREYQEETAAFFRGIGFDAETDQELTGVRTAHKIDVVARGRHVGFDVLWVIECKQWKSRINKLHVLALRTVVTEVGADRGILMAERGFQRGAQEAARLTNVTVTSLAKLEASASYDIGMAQLHDLQNRVDKCRERYWDLPKDFRIDQDLRPDVGLSGYSGSYVIQAVEAALNEAFRGRFPIDAKTTLLAAVRPNLFPTAADPAALFRSLDPMITDLEARLLTAETAFAELQTKP